MRTLILIAPTAHFSENWGFVSLSPLLGGNIFSIMFGQNLDAHAPSEPQESLSLLNTTMTRADTVSSFDSAHQCLLGRECYASSLLMTTAACTVALCLSAYAGWKDHKQTKRYGEHPHSQPAVVWDATED